MSKKAILIIVALISPISGRTYASSLENKETNWSFTTGDGCSIFVKEIGEGQPTLVFHGGPASDHAALVEPLVPLVEKARLIFFDQRGSLRSPCANDAVFTVDKIVSDVEQLIRIRGFTSVNIIGHSFGGISASSFIKANPSKVNKFLAIVPVPLVGMADEIVNATTRRRDMLSTRPAVDSVLSQEGLSREEPANEYDFSKWFVIHAASGNLFNVGKWAETSETFLNYRPQIGAQIVGSMGASWNFSDDIRRLGSRFHIILTDFDMLPLDFHFDWLDSLPRANRHIIKKAGHLVWIDQPGKFKNTLIAIFK